MKMAALYTVNAASSASSSSDRAIPEEIAGAAVLCLCLEAAKRPEARKGSYSLRSERI
jgi:hypothetical protein